MRGDEPRVTHILKARLTARLSDRSRSKLVFLSVLNPNGFDLRKEIEFARRHAEWRMGIDDESDQVT